jgi:hypothetical protein
MNMGRGQFRGRPVARFVPNPKLKFLDQYHEVMRFKQLAARTEETYLQWIRRFVLFHRRSKTLTILLVTAPFAPRRFFVTMNGAPWPEAGCAYLSVGRKRGERSADPGAERAALPTSNNVA